MFNDDFFPARDPGEIEPGVPLEHELDMQAQKVRLLIGERDTGFGGESQDKIGEFIVQGDRHRGRIARFPNEQLLSNTKLEEYGVEQFAVVFPAENGLKLSSRSFDLHADEFTIGV